MVQKKKIICLLTGKCQDTEQFEDHTFEFNIDSLDAETYNLVRSEVDKYYILK